MPQLRANIEYSCNLVVNSNIKLGKLKLREIFKLSDVDSPTNNYCGLGTSSDPRLHGFFFSYNYFWLLCHPSLRQSPLIPASLKVGGFTSKM